MHAVNLLRSCPSQASFAVRSRANSRRGIASKKPPSETALENIPKSSLAGKPSFAARKLPAGRKRIPERFLLPEENRASTEDAKDYDEDKEHAEV